MGTDLLTEFIVDNYEVHEWKHSCAILKNDFPVEWSEIIDLLENFRLEKSMIATPGGRKSPVSNFIDTFLYQRNWEEKSFDIKIEVDGSIRETPTHKIDCYKNNVALEIEWNNKDPFFDRDLNNFRLLFDLGAISVGVILTRCDELQDIFKEIGRGSSFGASTTHMSKLLPRLKGGAAGGCPILVLGISKKLFIDDMKNEQNNKQL